MAARRRKTLPSPKLSFEVHLLSVFSGALLSLWPLLSSRYFGGLGLRNAHPSCSPFRSIPSLFPFSPVPPPPPSLFPLSCQLPLPSSIVMTKAFPPELKKYMDRRLLLTLNANRKITGRLRGYDLFMNVVLDDAREELENGQQGKPVGMCVVRGNSILSMEVNQNGDRDNPPALWL